MRYYVAPMEGITDSVKWYMYGNDPGDTWCSQGH